MKGAGNVEIYMFCQVDLEKPGAVAYLKTGLKRMKLAY